MCKKYYGLINSWLMKFKWQTRFAGVRSLEDLYAWGSNQNPKNMHLLKVNFREILFYKYRTILKNFLPSSRFPLQHLQLLIWALNQKSTLTILFASEMLSKMIWHDPVAPKTMEEIDFKEKAWMQARGYPIGTGHVNYPLKCSLTAT